MSFEPVFTAADAASFESSVVPRYLSFFGALATDMLLPHSPAVIAHVGCRTGYPDGIIADKIPGSAVVGVDASVAALDMAAGKAALLSGVEASYHLSQAIPTALPGDSFTHAMCIHPIGNVEERSKILSELRRVLVPGGQALIALPLRGSFPEINDMIREFALRTDMADLSKAVDTAAASRPTIETISEEFENAGLTEVDVDVHLIAVSFNNGREFLEDPTARLMVMPDMRALLPLDSLTIDRSLQYVAEAIGKYWSEGVFELTINVGCASGRRLH
jgi:ubiquinone/menaquinone biosynthesis C-methylase UbiE